MSSDKKKFSKTLGEKSQKLSDAAKLPAANSTLKKVHLKKKSKKSFIGIDIGLKSIKIIQLVLVNDSLKISKLIVEDVPSEIINNSQDFQEGFLKFFRKVINKNNIKGEVFVIISNDKVDIQHMTLPYMPTQEIFGAIQSEVMVKSKANIDTISFDYVLLNEGEIKKTDTIKALVVIASRKDIIEYLDILELCNLNVLSIEANIFSLLASLNFNERLNQEEVILILDFEGESSNLSIVRNNKIHYTRGINTDGRAIIDAVKEAGNIVKDFSNQLNLFVVNGNKGEQEDHTAKNQEMMDKTLMIKSSVLIPFEKLISDIEHTFKYYSYRVTKSEVTQYDKIILCGELIDFSLLITFLKERLEVPVEVMTL